MKTVTFNQDGKSVDEDGNVVDLPQQIVEQLKIKEEAKKSQHAPPPEKEQQKETPKKEKKDEFIKPKVYTKYEVKPETYFYVKFGIVSQEDRWVVIDEEDVSVTKKAESHWVKFKMWNYAQELDWKNQATEFDNSKRMHTLNTDKLNELKIRNLLVDWSFAEDEDSLKMLHVNDLLCDESFKVFYSLYPGIIRHIVSKMNDVLEFNE